MINKFIETVFMNKLIIIAKNPHTYFIKRLQEQLPSTEIPLLNPWEQEYFSTQDNQVILVRTTSIHNSTKDLDFISTHKLKSIPSLHALNTLRTKPLQFKYFKQLGIPHLSWLDLEQTTAKDIVKFSQDKKRLLIKPKRGQGGWGIEVFEEVSELLSWWEKAQDREYMLQHYLEEHEEFRLFFIKEDYICLKRMKEGVAANFKQEGRAQVVELPAFLHQIIEKIRLDLDLHYGAADFLVSGQKAYLLEMNLVPGIEQLEIVSQKNIAKDLLISLSCL